MAFPIRLFRPVRPPDRQLYAVAMARSIEVAVHIQESIERVWEDLAELENHSDWMKDAEAIEFLTEKRHGAGTRIRVPTRIGPLRTVDEIEFTSWEPPNRMAIAHRGLFTGTGEISLQSVSGGTSVTWRESVTFPFRFGGPLGEFVAAPILRLVWRSNLKRLARRFG